MPGRRHLAPGAPVIYQEPPGSAGESFWGVVSCSYSSAFEWLMQTFLSIMLITRLVKFLRKTLLLLGENLREKWELWKSVVVCVSCGIYSFEWQRCAQRWYSNINQSENMLKLNVQIVWYIISNLKFILIPIHWASILFWQGLILFVTKWWVSGWVSSQ